MSTKAKEARLNNHLSKGNHRHTELSDRDRYVFLAMLEDAKAKPNNALKAAAREYKRIFWLDGFSLPDLYDSP